VVLPPITWNEASEDHIAQRHNVLPQEVEQVFYGHPRRQVPGKNGTTLLYGQTDAGRYLLVVTAPSNDGGTFIVTAREMTDTERKTFQKRGK
jgi:uncharacterized DUF497 family protein